MKTSILALAAGAAAVFGLMASQAQAGEFMAGLYAHGVGVKQSQEGGVDPLVGWRSEPIQALSWIWKPAVHVVAAVNTNVSTDFVAAGLDWRIPLGHDSRWYIQPGIGMAYTTGEANIGNAFAPGLSPAEMQRRLQLSHSRIDFGSKVLFEPELALGYDLSPRWNIEVSYIHLSNGEILHRGENQGLDDIGVRLAYRFGVR